MDARTTLLLVGLVLALAPVPGGARADRDAMLLADEAALRDQRALSRQQLREARQELADLKTRRITTAAHEAAVNAEVEGGAGAAPTEGLIEAKRLEIEQHEERLAEITTALSTVQARIEELREAGALPPQQRGLEGARRAVQNAQENAHTGTLQRRPRPGGAHAPRGGGC